MQFSYGRLMLLRFTASRTSPWAAWLLIPTQFFPPRRLISWAAQRPNELRRTLLPSLSPSLHHVRVPWNTCLRQTLLLPWPTRPNLCQQSLSSAPSHVSTIHPQCHKGYGPDGASVQLSRHLFDRYIVRQTLLSGTPLMNAREACSRLRIAIRRFRCSPAKRPVVPKYVHCSEYRRARSRPMSVNSKT